MTFSIQNITIICLFSFILTPLFAQEDLFSMIRNKVTVERVGDYLDSHPETLNSPSKEGFTPLILAAYSGNTQLVSYFIKRGSKIDYVSSMGTALMASVVKGHAEIAELLLINNAAVDLTDEKGTTALMYAVQFKNKKLIELLLLYHSDKTRTDINGKTAFEYAVFSGDSDIIKLLK